jgi:hypothetical protein
MADGGKDIEAPPAAPVDVVGAPVQASDMSKVLIRQGLKGFSMKTDAMNDEGEGEVYMFRYEELAAQLKRKLQCGRRQETYHAAERKLKFQKQYHCPQSYKTANLIILAWPVILLGIIYMIVIFGEAFFQAAGQSQGFMESTGINDSLTGSTKTMDTLFKDFMKTFDTVMGALPGGGSFAVVKVNSPLESVCTRRRLESASYHEIASAVLAPKTAYRRLSAFEAPFKKEAEKRFLQSGNCCAAGETATCSANNNNNNNAFVATTTTTTTTTESANTAPEWDFTCVLGQPVDAIIPPENAGFYFLIFLYLSPLWCLHCCFHPTRWFAEYEDEPSSDYVPNPDPKLAAEEKKLLSHRAGFVEGSSPCCCCPLCIPTGATMIPFWCSCWWSNPTKLHQKPNAEADSKCCYITPLSLVYNFGTSGWLKMVSLQDANGVEVLTTRVYEKGIWARMIAFCIRRIRILVPLINLFFIVPLINRQMPKEGMPYVTFAMLFSFFWWYYRMDFAKLATAYQYAIAKKEFRLVRQPIYGPMTAFKRQSAPVDQVAPEGADVAQHPNDMARGYLTTVDYIVPPAKDFPLWKCMIISGFYPLYVINSHICNGNGEKVYGDGMDAPFVGMYLALWYITSYISRYTTVQERTDAECDCRSSSSAEAAVAGLKKGDQRKGDATEHHTAVMALLALAYQEDRVKEKLFHKPTGIATLDNILGWNVTVDLQDFDETFSMVIDAKGHTHYVFNNDFINKDRSSDTDRKVSANANSRKTHMVKPGKGDV